MSNLCPFVLGERQVGSFKEACWLGVLPNWRMREGNVMTRRQASEWLESVEGGISQNSERKQVSTGYPQKETTDEEASWDTERNRASEGGHMCWSV